MSTNNLNRELKSNRANIPKSPGRMKVLSMIEKFDKPSTNARSIEYKEKKPVVPPKPSFPRQFANLPIQKVHKPFLPNQESYNSVVENKTEEPNENPKEIINYWKRKDKAITTTNVSRDFQTPSPKPQSYSVKAKPNVKNIKSKIKNFENIHKETILINNNINPKIPNKDKFQVNPVPKPRRIFTENKFANEHQKLDRNKNRINTFTHFNNHSYLTHIKAELANKGVQSTVEKIDVNIYSEPEENNSTSSGSSPLPRTPAKWKRQHEYEDVEFKFNGNSSDSIHGYDKLTWENKHHARSHSLSDNDGYAELKFESEIRRTESNHSLLSNPNALVAPAQDMDIDADSNSITDLIRSAYSPRTQVYSPTKANSSSNDDSDNEFERIKHKQTLDRVRTLQKNYRRTLKYKTLEGDLSGADYAHTKLFDRVIIVKISNDHIPKVSYSFPDSPHTNEEAIAHFCFPDAKYIQTYTRMPSQNYSFMLTDETGARQFGYCLRILPPVHQAQYPVVYCIISSLGSFALFHTILVELEQRHRVSIEVAKYFLKALHKQNFPLPGTSVHLQFKDERNKINMVLLRRPVDVRLEHVDLQCLLNEMGVESTIKVFVSLLLERRIILCGKSLNSLTACVYALRSILYPFLWQHVFIPVLPEKMLDLCCVPTPLLIGILHTSIDQLKMLPLEEVIIIDLSKKEVIQESKDELELLPKKLQSSLMKLLTSHTKAQYNTMKIIPKFDYATDIKSAERNNFISESFLHLFVEIFWNYHDHCKPPPQGFAPAYRGGKVFRQFNRQSFYDSISSRSVKRFLDLFMETQMFDGFIHARETSNAHFQEDLFEKRIQEHQLSMEDSKINVLKTRVKKLVSNIGPTKKSKA